MVILVKGASNGPTLYSVARARRYLQHNCSGFFAYVADSHIEGAPIQSEVPIINDFPDVFHKELHGVPPERKVKF